MRGFPSILSMIFSLSLLCGCPPSHVPDPELIAAGDLHPETITIQHRIQFKSVAGEFSGRAVIQKLDGKLEVIVLGEYGAPILHVLQKEHGVDLVQSIADFPEFDVSYLMRDIQWIFFAKPPQIVQMPIRFRWSNTTIEDFEVKEGWKRRIRGDQICTDINFKVKNLPYGAGDLIKLNDSVRNYSLTILIERVKLH